MNIAVPVALVTVITTARSNEVMSADDLSQSIIFVPKLEPRNDFGIRQQVWLLRSSAVNAMTTDA